jgi:peptidoglycan-associated lipoprotein
MGGGTRFARLTFGSFAVVLALSGCAGRSWQFWKSSSTEAPPTTPTQVAATETTTPAPASPSVPTAHPAPAAETTTAALAPTAAGFVELPAVTDVRFRPGLMTVGKIDAGTLDVLVRWLKDNPAAQVRIEGHTDDLGTPGENLAVGQKRATSVMSYLVSQGVSVQRISIISYGSDRPLCAEKTEVCRAKNRRVHFLVKQR